MMDTAYYNMTTEEDAYREASLQNAYDSFCRNLSSYDTTDYEEWC